MTLGAQSVDSNALLGNVDLSYKYHFFDGAVIPIGLGLSLILNAIFLARKINAEEGVLTLPDVLSRRYGKIVEILVGLVSIVSFLMLLAGNLVGMGIITAYVWGISTTLGIWLASIIVWTYTVTGGLFSVAYTDVVQGAIGWYVRTNVNQNTGTNIILVLILLFVVVWILYSAGPVALSAPTGSLPTPMNRPRLLQLVFLATSTRIKKFATCTVEWSARMLPMPAATTQPCTAPIPVTPQRARRLTTGPIPLATSVFLTTK